MTKLLIIDDSPLMRRLLTDIFTMAGDFEITAARSGAEALSLLHSAAPDVITLDVHMPEMDGLACLDRIMLERPCPVVMVSALTADGAEETLEALSLGAVDFIAKPKGALSLEIGAIEAELVDKVRSAARVRISGVSRLRDRVRATTSLLMDGQRTATAPPSPRLVRGASGRDAGLVLVGCSTGGPPALDALLGDLPASFPWPIVIAQHMPASFTGPLARRLDGICALDVREADRAMPLAAGCVYIAKGDADIIVSRRSGALVAMPAPCATQHHWHPSADRLVESAMRHLPPRQLIGVLMTGMGNDGASAMAKLHASGGFTIAEAQSTAIVWGMPGALAGLGGASQICPLDEIAEALIGQLTP